MIGIDRDQPRTPSFGTTCHISLVFGSIGAPDRPIAVGTPLTGRLRSRHGWAFLFGAACPERVVGAGVMMPRADLEAMKLHSAGIASSAAPGALPDAFWTAPDGMAVAG